MYVDVVSLCGRLAKDRFNKLRDPAPRLAAARESAEHYRRAFAVSGDYFPGINAASMSLVAGDEGTGKRMAAQVHAACTTLSATAPAGDYWLPATLGEACLLLDRQAEAAEWYAKAAQLAGDRFGDVASMRRQMRMLSEFLDIHQNVLSALDIPKVVAFAGHMIDAPNVERPRFPPDIEPRVRTGITAVLERLGADFGYSSVACGADILFVEAMLERGGEAHIVLPFKREDFVETSVRFAGADWVARLKVPSIRPPP